MKCCPCVGTLLLSLASIAEAQATGQASDDATSANTARLVVVCVVGGLLLLSFTGLLIYCWRRKADQGPDLGRKPYGPPAWHIPMEYTKPIEKEPLVAQIFTYKELQQATNDFYSRNLLGEGGFGRVYKASFSDGRIAAVKRLDRNRKQGDHEFRVEVDMLTRFRCPYLLELMGYCADDEQRLLVYAYMPRGSLQEHLYSSRSPRAPKEGRPPVLDWAQRLQIAVDVARGLEYLHEVANPQVIHRDLKSSNVLLDVAFRAKVSDFGLAKQGPMKEADFISTRVLGTQGYVAPEYALTGHLTSKSDVYSYGVVLLELLTGRAPVDPKRPAEESVLVSWALPLLMDRSQLLKLVDPFLAGQYTMKDLVQVAAIATMCVQPEAEYRPLMTDVVQSMLPLVKTAKSAHAKAPEYDPQAYAFHQYESREFGTEELLSEDTQPLVMELGSEGRLRLTPERVEQLKEYYPNDVETGVLDMRPEDGKQKETADPS